MLLCKPKRVAVILGPTATGKSALALALAQHLPTEIISGDSMLVYRGFNIGTAKPTAAELAQVPHHLIDIKEPTEKYSAAEFQTDAARLIDEITDRNRLPVVVGGTGLYIKALLEGYEFRPAPPHEIYRRELESVLAKDGTDELYRRLSVLDPHAAATVDRHNPRRLIRALEAARFDDTSARSPVAPNFSATVIGLSLPRPLLYERINRRVDRMMAAGLADELKSLLAAGIPPNAPAMQGIGYKELLPYIDGQTNPAAAVEAIKIATRHFAKRQLTWYKKMPYIRWLDANQPIGLLTEELLDTLISPQKTENQV